MDEGVVNIRGAFSQFVVGEQSCQPKRKIDVAHFIALPTYLMGGD